MNFGYKECRLYYVSDTIFNTMKNQNTPSNLHELLHEVFATECEDPTASKRADILLALIRKHHFWPALQVKKFFDHSGLVLLHNTYKRTDVDSFRPLYEECRSVVLDFGADEGNHIVVTLAHSVPDRMTDQQYKSYMQEMDRAEISYEGTMIHVYKHKDTWRFGTSSCPSVDSSRYFHPTKTHGVMLDEALHEMFCSEQPFEDSSEHRKEVRDKFTSHLDETLSYTFLLVHHENSHIMDYTVELGEKYHKVFHIGTRSRTEHMSIPRHKVLEDIGVRYAQAFENATEALNTLTDKMYGIIVYREDGTLLKVSHTSIVEREECDLGNPNKWVNILWVYMQNKPHYQIKDYVSKYAPKLDLPKDPQGRELSPSYIVHTVMCTMQDILYGLYLSTTTYFVEYRRFRMDKVADGKLSPILRFHLAQLRYLQINNHTHSILTMKAVYHYMCHHTTIKDIRLLISFFASNNDFSMRPRQALCFKVLSELLSE